ncbi:hypothetical protein F4X10_18490 [Candidatus Poribacteria bacterium]|nr:hypothetical protein [Candidatus Poribacteria bacterium]
MKRQLMSLTAGVACVLFALLLCVPASDSTHIAFSSPRDGNNEIYIMNTTDSTEEHLQNLTNHPAFDWYPAFSPDGQWIAFVSNRSGANRIYLMHRNRNELHPLTKHLGSNADFDPDWSPDGQWIVFTSRADIPKADPNIYKINVNSGALQQLTDTGYNRFPKWSPDGDRILFYSGRKEAKDLFLMKPNGNGVRRVIERRHGGSEPTWSPDGKQIAYEMTDLAGVGIYIMTDEGQNNRRITRDNTWAAFPAWSPNGQWIAYELEIESPWGNPNRDSNIHLVSPDGIETRQLTKHPARDILPAWVPEAFLSVSPTAEKQTTLWGRLKKSIK